MMEYENNDKKTYKCSGIQLSFTCSPDIPQQYCLIFERHPQRSSSHHMKRVALSNERSGAGQTAPRRSIYLFKKKIIKYNIVETVATSYI